MQPVCKSFFVPLQQKTATDYIDWNYEVIGTEDWRERYYS